MGSGRGKWRIRAREGGRAAELKDTARGPWKRERGNWGRGGRRNEFPADDKLLQPLPHLLGAVGFEMSLLLQHPNTKMLNN